MSKLYGLAVMQDDDGRIIVMRGRTDLSMWKSRMESVPDWEEAGYKMKQVMFFSDKVLYLKASLEAKIKEYWAYEEQVEAYLDELIAEYPKEVAIETEILIRHNQEDMCVSIARMLRRILNNDEGYKPHPENVNFLTYCTNALNERKRGTQR